MKELAIILLNYNNPEDTLDCVESIEKNCKDKYKIVVVDNNSTDGSQEILVKNQHRYKLILNTVNEGFANGNNVAIKWALEEGYENVMLLNNDTLVTPNSIETMLEYIKDNENAGIVAPRIMYYPDKEKIWFDGGEIDWFKFIVKHNGMKSEVPNKIDKDWEKVSFITGCCMLIKGEVIEKVGLLSEEYFMYYEDVDYCVKVQEAGYELISLKKPYIYHKVSSSSGGEDSPFSIKWGTRNRIIFMNKFKYYSKGIKFKFSVGFFYLSRIMKLVNYKIHGDKDRYLAIIDGIKEGKKYIREVK